MSIKVVSFNVRCCGDPDGHSINERAPRLAQVLSAENADIMGFQEYTAEMKACIESGLTEKYEIFSKPRAEGDRESVPILWKKDRFDCIDKGWFWFSDTPEVESKGWDEIYDCYRICMWVVLKDKKIDKSFIYMNTHYGFGDKGQCDSSELINEYTSRIAKLPVVVTGDFNMTPDSAGYKTITRYFTDVNAVTVNDNRPTYHGYNRISPEKQAHIDYCFIKGKIKPESYKMLDVTFDGKFPSDHHAITATISFL